MKRLTIELVKGQKRELQVIGWKRPQEGRIRRQFYAQDEKGKPVVLTAVPAAPEFCVPGFPAVFTGEPFPEAVCVELSSCRLLPPPCYQDRDEYERQRLCHAVFEPWRVTYLRTHDQFLFLVPQSDPPLQERLDNFLKAMRASCKREMDHWKMEIARLTNSSLEDLKLGALGIRELYLHEQWARDSGEDLEAMALERRLFRDWLEAHTGTPAKIFYATTRQTRQGVKPPNFGERFENNPQFLEACARVKYRARFADNAGSVVFLCDFEEREELDAAELEEVAKLRPGPSSGEIEAKAAHQRTLSSGLMLTVGPLVQKMTGDERLLFNFLLKPNPKRPGWALSYRAIGEDLGVSQTEVQRRRDSLVKRYGREIGKFIAEARIKNDKGLNPDQCGSGGKVSTANRGHDDD